MVSIVEIKPENKKLFKEFIEFPNKLYKDNPHYVPFLYGDELNLLNPEKNASFEECEAKYFLAYENGKIQGRVCGLIQKMSNKIRNEKKIRFTRFDFVNNIDVVKALLNAVEGFGREQGMDTVVGPLGFNDMDKEGMLIEGFDRDVTMASMYNYDYYYPLIQQCGYDVECTWLEYRIKVPDTVPDKINRIAQIAEKHNKLSLVEFKSKKHLKQEYLNKILDTYDETYAQLPGTVPLSLKLRQQIADQFLIIMNLDYFPVVQNEEGKVVAFGLSFPLVSEAIKGSGGHLYPHVLIKMLKEVRHPTGIELGIIGVLPEYRKTGALAMIMKTVIEQCNHDGITEVETNLELVENQNIQSMWSAFEREQHKKRVCVRKKITEE